MTDYPDIETLYAAAVEAMARPMSWREGWPETWNAWEEAVPCAECDGEDEAKENCETCGGTGTDDGEESLFPGVKQGEPMMDRLYSLPYFTGDERDAAKLSGPLCLVHLTPEEHPDEWGLALTGGGMDLSWEICEAYMQLGFLPPAQFAQHLPDYGSYGEREHWIMAGCAKSLEVVTRRLWHGLEGLTRLEGSRVELPRPLVVVTVACGTIQDVYATKPAKVAVVDYDVTEYDSAARVCSLRDSEPWDTAGDTTRQHVAAAHGECLAPGVAEEILEAFADFRPDSPGAEVVFEEGTPWVVEPLTGGKWSVNEKVQVVPGGPVTQFERADEPQS